MLERAGRIEPDLSRRMQAMAGFQNIAVNDYQNLSLEVVKASWRITWVVSGRSPTLCWTMSFEF